MSTVAAAKAVEARILDEGYGPGAWHGADMKAALSDVGAELAFCRPGQGRHNIAEIALHHAYCIRNVTAKLSGVEAPPFVLDGDDWFELTDESRLAWSTVLDTVEREQRRLASAVSEAQDGPRKSALADSERFDLVVGITCHAVYHAGQVQLIKRLRS